MKKYTKTSFAVWAALSLSLSGCAHKPALNPVVLQYGESVVLVREEPARFAFPLSPSKPLRVRSTYEAATPQTMNYEELKDFTVDYATGQIRRTPNSRIPDFSTNMLFGVSDFDHSKYPGFGNGSFFVFADYGTLPTSSWPHQSDQTRFLPGTLAKLKAGKPIKIVAYGDSITAGGDATKPELIFWQRWGESLQKKYPTSRIELVNGATGGDSTRNGLDRLQQKVISQKPDLVLVGFGMNDHNIGGYGVPVEEFAKNLKTIIERIRKETGAEIILYSTFPPNPKWRFGSHNMTAYADATERVATEMNCAFADVYRNWNTIADRKKPEDLLGNNINHPNDFGHWIYFRVLQEIGF